MRVKNPDSINRGRYFLIAQDDSICPFLRDIHSGQITPWDEDRLELVGITWETLMEGDVLIAEGGKELTILGRQNSILFLSRHNRPTSYSGGFTIEDCIAEGYSIKNTTEEEVQEMTVEEISKLVGKTVKVVEKK